MHPAASAASVGSSGETELIRRIQQIDAQARGGAERAFVRVGMGDDAAVLEPPRGELDVLTTDSQVEGVHFRREWTSARAIGAKAVAVNLSDLAAMGATPRAVLLSLILPAGLPLDDFDGLVEGVVDETHRAGATLVGGNISRSPGPLVVDVTATGAVGRRRVLRRSGGRAGDELYVTGAIGAAAAGLAMLQAGVDRDTLDADGLACLRRYEHPEARMRCGRLVAAARGASACIDLSDGLANAARQIAQASGTGVEIDAERLPIATGAARWLPSADPLGAAIDGGEDYELLFAVPRKRRRAFHAAMQRCRPVITTLVGRLTKGADHVLVRDGRPAPLNSGFQHFPA